MIPRSRTGNPQDVIKNLKRKKPTNGTSFTRVVRGSAGLGRPVWVLLSLASALTPESLPKHGFFFSFVCSGSETLQTEKWTATRRHRVFVFLHDSRGYGLLKWPEGTNHSWPEEDGFHA